MGRRAVGGRSPDLDGKTVAAGHPRAVLEVDRADVQLGPDVHSENGVHALQRPALYILLRFSSDLLGHLENQLRRALKLLPVRPQDAGRPQKHGRVAVVTAGVHHARIDAAVGFSRIFLDRQGVDVRPEHHRLSRLAALDGGDAARDALEGLYGNPLLLQLSDDIAGGFHLVLPHLRVSVEVAAAVDDILFLLLRKPSDIHQSPPPAVFSR